ncbi:MAG TPA: sigma-70 family RNA polymerase sigma factor [Polyangiaceae bacterium]|nr:sigma-70 family RNA polymerase sigma factor [Polyangiaceae bacterium]
MIEARLAGTLAASNVEPAAAWPSDVARQARMAAQHYDFIWRSLRRLGVAEQAADDAAQRVFVIAAEKMARIAPDCERAFLFQTAVRVAMSIRRTYARRREAMVGDALDDFVDPAPLPDAMAEERQRRRYLDELLDTLPMDLRTVFVLYEIEGLDSPEIASMLEIAVGTVASRLRRARETFRRGAERLRTRLERRASR